MDETRKWGFDLTDFGRNWPKGVKALKLTLETHAPDMPWRWSAPGLIIDTCSNPLTGEYYRASYRAPEKGYASSIGIDGERAAVMKAVALIHEHAEYIKGESPNDREFC